MKEPESPLSGTLRGCGLVIGIILGVVLGVIVIVSLLFNHYCTNHPCVP